MEMENRPRNSKRKMIGQEGRRNFEGCSNNEPEMFESEQSRLRPGQTKPNFPAQRQGTHGISHLPVISYSIPPTMDIWVELVVLHVSLKKIFRIPCWNVRRLCERVQCATISEIEVHSLILLFFFILRAAGPILSLFLSL